MSAVSIILIAIALFLFLAWAVLLLIAKHVFKVKSKPHIKTPEDYGIGFEEIKIPTKNMLSLYGWWIPCQVKSKVPTIILVHGWKRNVERMMPYIKNLHQSFNLLAFDARCHGSSNHDNYSSMPRFAEDIESALDYLFAQQGKELNVGVIGLSIGGAASIYETSFDDRLNKIVTVGAFANPEEIMKLQMKSQRLPYIPLGWLLLRYVEFKIGKKFRKIAPENNIGNTNAKILLVHGKEDTTAPYQHAERLYNLANKENVVLWGLEGKGHSDCHTHSEFWKRIESFLSN